MATKFNDQIFVNLEDQVVDALAGDDRVWVTATGALINGGTGNDWLSTDLSFNSEDTAHLTTELHGDGGADQIYAAVRLSSGSLDGSSVEARIYGGDEDDTIWLRMGGEDVDVTATVDGGDGDDTIDIAFNSSNLGSTSRLNASGGQGDDSIHVFIANASSGGYPPIESSVSGGDGTDDINVQLHSSDVSNLISAGDGDDHVVAVSSGGSESGASLNNMVQGGEGADSLDLYAGSGGNTFEARNEAHGGEDNDRIAAVLQFDYVWSDSMSDATNVLYGDGGDDRLFGRVASEDAKVRAHSELFGGAGNDRLKVSGGNDNFLWGNLGDDTLLGSANDDHLIGGQGADYLKGYGGEDTFEFQSARNGERDRIADFTIGEDVIDISRIDANVWRGGNQAFTFDVSGHGGTGRVWAEDYGSKTIIHADTGRAILNIVLADGWSVDASSYTANDFLL